MFNFHMIAMSGDIIVGIDNLSLLILCTLIAVELYASISGNDILLVLGLGAIILVYIIRIRNRRKSSPNYAFSPEKNKPTEEIQQAVVII
jgi:hypothetical protein